MLGVGAIAQNAQSQTFFTELKVYRADKIEMTIRYWQDGTNIRREYDTRLPVTYVTNKDGTYIIVNNQDRGVRVNTNAPMLEGRFIEQYAAWPMKDLDGFVKEWNAKQVAETPLTVAGKKFTALKYTYPMKSDPKEMVVLYVDKATKKPLQVRWGKNQNINIPLTKLKEGMKVTYETRVDFIKYAKGDAISKDLFKAPAQVMDAGDGKMFGKLNERKPAAAGG